MAAVAAAVGSDTFGQAEVEEEGSDGRSVIEQKKIILL